MKSAVNILQSLKTPRGLFLAAPAKDTGYDKAWIRDNIYASLGVELVNEEDAVKIIWALFDIFRKHEDKIDWAIREKPNAAFKYIHARYHPETLDEFWEEWGNKQNDAVGAFLFRVGDLLDKGIKILRDEKDRAIVRKLISYLASVEYWADADNGVWEEAEEVHASSVGACLAGLEVISKYFDVPAYLIVNGRRALDELLPNESLTRGVDLALLSLIYPFNVVNKEQRDLILKNVEEKLVRTRGVLRYLGDKYYNLNGEAEWTMGLPWLAKIYKDLGNRMKYEFYMNKTIFSMNSLGELPELYFSGTNRHNDNSPLGWAQSLYVVAVLG